MIRKLLSIIGVLVCSVHLMCGNCLADTVQLSVDGKDIETAVAEDEDPSQSSDIITYLYNLLLAGETAAETLTVQITPEDISSKGNVHLPISIKEMSDAGYSFGDMLSVEIGTQTINLPFGNSFTDVDSGSPGLICRDQDDDALLFVNMGSFCSEFLQGVLDDKTEEWSFPKEATWPQTISISLKKKCGYLFEYLMHNLSYSSYSNERNDYPQLTDEEFGNFREVSTTGMGKGVLYRCSSPINPKIGRNLYVDQAIRDAGVTVIMNLSDSAEEAEGFEGFGESYYATKDFIALKCGIDFTDNSFREKLKEGLEFFVDHPGVYAIHCTEGKDRTGIVAALLESLMGADILEVVDDYMTTFYNYYGITHFDSRFNAIAESNICKSLKKMFGINDLDSADLAKCAEEYLTGIGMSSESIEKLKKNLSTDMA